MIMVMVMVIKALHEHDLKPASLVGYCISRNCYQSDAHLL